MSIDFGLPIRPGGTSNLSVSMSPLGLIDMSDEEYEVNGPRIARYATNWASYLGMQYARPREAGEPQLVFNYFSAFTDYLGTFTFGRGFDIKTPPETEAIVPTLIQRVWEIDNNRHQVLWEMGQQGGVTGDCFVKVAYEEPYVDTVKRQHPGRVRILPLTSAHCFPEFHPHDRERLLRFKLKYKIMGTSPEGTRQVYTYTEILTDTLIQEFVNDQLIDERPNPLGVIPIVHIANREVSGSPWGLADCHEIIAVNREYNDKAVTIADIINYHGSPITIITGAKASNLEKGAKKIWAIPTAGVEVKNLELDAGAISAAMEYLNMLKIYMHEATGVPETALGQAQPISNTSGVALSIQFQPLMQKFKAKTNQYARGLQKINEYILLTLAVKEPQTFVWDPDSEVELKENQLDVLDPADPITYRTEVHFPPPLPIDKLILLNELQTQMTMGLESKRGAMRMLGEEFPDAKLAEIRDELMDDAKADGALQLLKTAIAKEITELTGMMPGPDGAEMPPLDDSMVGSDANGNPTGSPKPQMPEPTTDITDVLEAQSEYAIRKDLVVKAFGTRTPKRQQPSENPPAGES